MLSSWTPPHEIFDACGRLLEFEREPALELSPRRIEARDHVGDLYMMRQADELPPDSRRDDDDQQYHFHDTATALSHLLKLFEPLI